MMIIMVTMMMIVMIMTTALIENNNRNYDNCNDLCTMKIGCNFLTIKTIVIFKII